MVTSARTIISAKDSMNPHNNVSFLASYRVFFQVGIVWCVLFMGTFTPAPTLAQENAARSYAVLIGGLGGSDAYTTTFLKYLFDTRKALVERFGFDESDVFVLCETPDKLSGVSGEVSTAENISARFADLADRVTASDHIYVFLFGHGSYDGQHAQLNIPRRDLNDADYAALLEGLQADRLIFINTTSASGPFVQALSAPDRIIITATRTGTERNETVFPRFLVEALQNPVADLDKDSRISVRELFTYATENTARFFETENNLATEHAMLEDTGDGQGYRLEELDQAGEGALASVTFLRRSPSPALAGESGPAATGPQLQEKESLERAIAELISRKSRLNEEQYYDELETLFVRLARLNNEIENSN